MIFRFTTGASCGRRGTRAVGPPTTHRLPISCFCLPLLGGRAGVRGQRHREPCQLKLNRTMRILAKPDQPDLHLSCLEDAGAGPDVRAASLDFRMHSGDSSEWHLGYNLCREHRDWEITMSALTLIDPSRNRVQSRCFARVPRRIPKAAPTAEVVAATTTSKYKPTHRWTPRSTFLWSGAPASARPPGLKASPKTRPQ